MHTRRNICFYQRGDISTLNGCSLKLVDNFTYTGSSVSLTETDINTWLAKTWTAFDRLSVIWKSDLTWNKTQFFPSSGRVDAAIWMHYIDIWRNVWRKSSMATTQECCKQCWTIHGGNTPKSSNCTATNNQSRKLSKLDEPDMQDMLTASHGREKAGRSARTYIQHLCANTWCSPEDLPEAMDDREGCAREGQRDPCWWCDVMMMMMMRRMTSTLLTIICFQVTIPIYW